MPELLPAPGSPEPVVPVRFDYGGQALHLNAAQAIGPPEPTLHSGQRGSNRPRIIKGTGKPW